MTSLKSLGYRSELIFTSFDGKVDDRGRYTVLRTLTNPNFFWGNLLVFDRPPKLGDCAEWVRLFKNEFPDPRIYHVTLAWDSNDGAIGNVSEFLERGFELEAKAVLTASKLRPPPKHNRDLQVRPLVSDEEWEKMIEIQVRSAGDTLPKLEWEKFYRSQSVRYRAMANAKIGDWYGGFLNGRLVTGLGIFHKDRLARYQIVCTDPDFQRQGLCGTLVYQSALQSQKSFEIETFVMCADPDYHAIKIYESVGFEKQQLEYGVYWWDRAHTLEGKITT
jgi:ribosomal protein S18 acetylase RimI-like enzyme